MHDNDRSPCALRRQLWDADALITPHGFQSMLLLLLPPPVSPALHDKRMLFEIFPHRYYKRAYGPLSKELGVYHSSAMSPPITKDRQILLSIIPTSWCMYTKYCREYARGDDVL